jgi:NitT/TauT family transport system substrate-binding protein
LNLPGYGLLVHKDTLEKKSEALAKIVAINQRAWNYIVQGHEVEGADAIVSQRASLRPDRDSLAAQVKIYAGLLGSPGTKGKPIGWQSEAEWDEALRIMTEAGVVKPGLKGADMFTNSFVK